MERSDEARRIDSLYNRISTLSQNNRKQVERIKKFENFLREKVAIAKVSADNENYCVNITIKEIEQVLEGGG